MRPAEQRQNPIIVGLEFIKYLEQHPGATYDDLGEKYQLSKARVCQMIALIKKLPKEIKEFFISEDNNHDILQYFNERKLRKLITLKSDIEMIEKFNEMRERIEFEVAE